MYFLYILFAILIFGFLIGIHEFGHFITAKLFKIKVNEFAIGMGPALLKKQKGETLYALRVLPIGGYCAMEGEDGESDDPRAFANASWWKKLIVLVAGAGMNFLTGFVMFLIMVGCTSFYQYWGTTTLENVEPGSAMEGQMLPGDRIYQIDGERIYTASDITMLLSLNLSEKKDIHDVVVVRNGEKVLLDDLNMEPRELPDGSGGKSLRYGMNFTVEKRSLPGTFRFTWDLCRNNARTVVLSLKMLIRGDVGMKDMAGPVGIVKTMADVGTSSGSSSAGFWNVISLGAFIAINLGLMNLLPIPALDGGRVVGVLLTGCIEGITQKKLNPKIEGYIHAGGMVVLLGLMALILFKDVWQILLR